MRRNAYVACRVFLVPCMTCLILSFARACHFHTTRPIYVCHQKNAHLAGQLMGAVLLGSVARVPAHARSVNGSSTSVSTAPPLLFPHPGVSNLHRLFLLPSSRGGRSCDLGGLYPRHMDSLLDFLGLSRRLEQQTPSPTRTLGHGQWTDFLTLPAPSRGGRRRALRQENVTRLRCLDWILGIRSRLVVWFFG